jgi:hypothetical protein
MVATVQSFKRKAKERNMNLDESKYLCLYALVYLLSQGDSQRTDLPMFNHTEAEFDVMENQLASMSFRTVVDWAAQDPDAEVAPEMVSLHNYLSEIGLVEPHDDAWFARHQDDSHAFNGA